MSNDHCSINSKATKYPEFYKCIKGRSVVKKKYRGKKPIPTECKPEGKLAKDKRYICNEKTNFLWKLKKNYKLVPVPGAPKKPLTPYFRWLATVRGTTGLTGKAEIQELARRWRDVLTPQDKDTFTKAYNQEKIDYDTISKNFTGPRREIVEKPKRKLSKYSQFMKDNYNATAQEVAVKTPNWETLKQTEKLKLVTPEVVKKWRAIH
jgi:hypothetical protein